MDVQSSPDVRCRQDGCRRVATIAEQPCDGTGDCAATRAALEQTAAEQRAVAESAAQQANAAHDALVERMQVEYEPTAEEPTEGELRDVLAVQADRYRAAVEASGRAGFEAAQREGEHSHPRIACPDHMEV